MTKSGIGEFELIARLASRLTSSGEPGLTGIGDDAAAIPSEGGFLLLTCDSAVEGRHFVRGLTPPADLGWRVATANVSDVAACGGLPAYALISLAVPEEIAEEALEQLYDGFQQAAHHYGFQVVGGNVTGAGQWMVDCFMVGRTPRFVARRGARPGELIAVSGTLGDSDAGRALLGTQPAQEGARALLQRHLRPRARTDLVAFLREHASAAIDISDSLAAELHHLAQAGGVRMEVEREAVPVSAALAAFARERGEPPLERALFGGEDFQLLCTLPAGARAAAETAGFTVIGRVAGGEGVSLSGEPLAAVGWDHLRPGHRGG